MCKYEEEVMDIILVVDKIVVYICSICGLFFEDVESFECYGLIYGVGEKENSRIEIIMLFFRVFVC